MIEFKGHNDSDSVNLAMQTQLKKNKIILFFTIFFVVIGIIFLVFTYLDYVDGESIVEDIMFAVFCFSFAIFYKPLAKWISNKVQAKQNQSDILVNNNCEITYKFDEDKVFIFTTLGEKYRSAVEAQYDYFFKIIETQEAYILFVTKITCYVIKKSDIVSGTIEKFNQLLSRKILPSKLEKC